jgi:hypothetical protein
MMLNLTAGIFLIGVIIFVGGLVTGKLAKYDDDSYVVKASFKAVVIGTVAIAMSAVAITLNIIILWNV